MQYPRTRFGESRLNGRLPFPALSPLVAWVVLLTVFGVSYGPALLDLGLLNSGTVKQDFSSFYAAARAAFELRISPYDPEILKGLAPGRVWPFIYPPQSLLFLGPLASLTYDQADAAVVYQSLLSLFLLLWFIPLGLFGLSPQRHWPLICLFFVVAATFLPVELTFREGQVNLGLTLLIVLFWTLAQRGRDRLATLFLACAIALKAYPAIILLLMLAIRRHRLVWLTIGWMAGLTAVAAMILPSEIWLDWLTNVVPSGGYGKTVAGLAGPASFGNLAINGVLSRAFVDQLVRSSVSPDPLMNVPAVARCLAYAFGLALIAITFRVLRRAERTLPAEQQIGFATMAALPLIVLVAPISWEHYLTTLMPVLLGFLLLPTPSARALWFRIVAGAVLYFLLDAKALLPLRVLPVLLLWALLLWRLEPVPVSVRLRPFNVGLRDKATGR